MTNCPICNNHEIDSNCEINLNWKDKEQRGTYNICIHCWDDLQSLLSSDVSLPYSGNSLNVSLKEEPSEGKLAIYDYVPTKCVDCGSRDLYFMEGTKLNSVERRNRTCRKCGIIMFLKEGLE